MLSLNQVCHFEIIASPLHGKEWVKLTAGKRSDVVAAYLNVDDKIFKDKDGLFIHNMNMEYSLGSRKFYKHPTTTEVTELVAQNSVKYSCVLRRANWVKSYPRLIREHEILIIGNDQYVKISVKTRWAMVCL